MAPPRTTKPADAQDDTPTVDETFDAGAADAATTDDSQADQVTESPELDEAAELPPNPVGRPPLSEVAEQGAYKGDPEDHPIRRQERGQED